MTETQPVRKRRHVFRWVFLAIQVIFLIWIIAGATSASSNADCGTLDAQTCHDATAVGTGIGVALIIGLWVAVDVILALTYLIFGRKK